MFWKYTLFANASLHGTPPVRALFWEFPDEPELFAIDRQFMIGRDILVTPVLEPNVSTVDGTRHCLRFSFFEIIVASRILSRARQCKMVGLVHS